MKNLSITHLKSIFRAMAIMAVLTVVVAIVPSCKGKSKLSEKETLSLLNPEGDNDSLVRPGENVPSDAPGPPPPPSPLPYKIYDGDTVWFRVDKLPVFSADSLALMDFLSKNLVYPETAKKKKVQGRVVVGFVLTKECNITNVKLVTGIDPNCDEEAIRVIKLLPRFEKPAYVNGRPVAYHFTLPVHYTLQ